MLTVHLLTKNNGPTIRRALDSIAALNARVLVADLGGADDTAAQCRARGAAVFPLAGARRDAARNFLLDQAPAGTHFYLEPWEALVQGTPAPGPGVGDARVLQGTTVTHEARVWDGRARFVNPAFERLDAGPGRATGVVLRADGGPDPADALAGIAAWKAEAPLAAAPHYYHACVLFAQGRYDEFVRVADHFLFMERAGTAAVMTRYHLAVAHLVHRRDHRAALQHLNLCLCAKPLMAEFWCLTGDVFYHLLSRFGHAKEFYENALALGARRLTADRWPMDFSKYGRYPRLMIESCEKIAAAASTYGQASRR